MKVDLVFAVRHQRIPVWWRLRARERERERERERNRWRLTGRGWRKRNRKRKTEACRLFITFTSSTSRVTEWQRALCIIPAATRQMAIVWTRNVGSNGCPSGPLFQLFQASIIARGPPCPPFSVVPKFVGNKTTVYACYVRVGPSPKNVPTTKQTICYL